MEELLGTLLPLLLSGAGLEDILQQLGGAGRSSASIDGLAQMRSAALFRARMAYPATTPGASIGNSIETALGRMGFDPYGQKGQAATAFLGSIYHVAPNLVGGLLGIPNGQQFMSQIANGAAGINAAAGFGGTDMFSPGGVMAAHKRAMDMANIAYQLGTRPGGGYNIDYGHGLNMDEMGRVTQRLLSSDVAFRDESGKRIDPEKESQKFKDNLERLGSKFNEAASMLSKVTGSVDEALKFMDRLAGGNFLGGSQEHATEIANRAKRMATSIRVMSAMSGMNPTEMYAQMQGMANNMAAGMGINPYVANASGFSAITSNMAYNAMMGYGAWAATHPGATEDQKAAARLAIESRNQGFMRENGSAFAAMIADNKDRFTEGQLNNIMDAARTGRINDMVGLAQNVLGNATYNEYMTNPAMKVAAMDRAYKNNRDFFENISGAMVQGNLEQAEREGAKLVVGNLSQDLNVKMMRTAGKGFEDARRAAIKRYLVDQAEKAGISREEAEGWTERDLRRSLKELGKYDSKEENLAVLSEARKQIEDNTISKEEEKDAASRLANEIDRAGISEGLKTSLKRKLIKEPAKIDEVYEELKKHKNAGEWDKLHKRVYGGKMSRTESASLISDIDKNEKEIDGNYTDMERFAAYDKYIGERNLKNMGKLKDAALGKDGKIDVDQNMLGAMERFGGMAKKLEDDGIIRPGDDMDATYKEAMTRMVSGVFGDKLGDLEGEELEKFNSRLADRMLDLIKGGKAKNVREAFEQAMEGKEVEVSIGKEGQKAVEYFRKNARDDTSKVYEKLGGSNFFSIAANLRESQETGADRKSVARIKDMLNGNFGDLKGKEAYDAFVKNLRDAGFQIKKEDFDKYAEEFGKDISDNDTAKKRMSDLFAKVQSDGLKGSSFLAASATGDPNRALSAIAAMQYYRMGGDVTKMKDFGFSEEMMNLVSGLDKDTSERLLNPVANAWRSGTGDFAQNAIGNTEKRIEALKDIISENESDIKGFASGDKDATKRLKKAITDAGMSVSDSDMALLKTLGKGAKIGGKDAFEVLKEYNGLGELKDKDLKKYNESMLNIARGAGRNEGEGYKLMTDLGDFVRKMFMFIGNPEQGMKVFVTNKVKAEGV